MSTYEERGGFRKNKFSAWGWRVTWPFARFLLKNDNLIVISVFNHKYKFRKENVKIESVYYFPIIVEGIRLTIKKTGEVFYYWSLNSNNLVSILKEKEFRVFKQ